MFRQQVIEALADRTCLESSVEEHMSSFKLPSQLRFRSCQTVSSKKYDGLAIRKLAVEFALGSYDAGNPVL